jgi:hypothetical protein
MTRNHRFDQKILDASWGSLHILEQRAESVNVRTVKFPLRGTYEGLSYENPFVELNFRL